MVLPLAKAIKRYSEQKGKKKPFLSILDKEYSKVNKIISGNR